MIGKIISHDMRTPFSFVVTVPLNLKLQYMIQSRSEYGYRNHLPSFAVNVTSTCTLEFIKTKKDCHSLQTIVSGFPRRQENLLNKNGHGKVMEHEKLAKSHGVLLSVMEFYQFCL